MGGLLTVHLLHVTYSPTRPRPDSVSPNGERGGEYQTGDDLICAPRHRVC